MLGHQWHANETPFNWLFTCEPMMAHLKWYVDHLSPHQLEKKQKNVVKVEPPLTKLSVSAHDKHLLVVNV